MNPLAEPFTPREERDGRVAAHIVSVFGWGLLLALAYWAASSPAQSPATVDRWLTRTRLIESGGNRHALGDGGRSRGPYQIQRDTWRSLHGRQPWCVWAHDENESRRVARRYLLAAVVRHWVLTGRAPTFGDIRYWYTHGLRARPPRWCGTGQRPVHRLSSSKFPGTMARVSGGAHGSQPPPPRRPGGAGHSSE